MDNEEETNEEAKRLSHTVRHRDGGQITISGFTRGKAIKLMCSECMGFEGDPKECSDKKCPLYPYRGSTLANRTRKEKTEGNE